MPPLMRFEHGVLHFGHFSAPDLISRFGSPLYLYHAAVLRRQAERLRGAFSGMPLQPCYAMKANGNLSILRLLREYGLGIDAVSPGEIFLARQAGVPPEAIWFTCSNVSDADLLAIGDERIVVNVNSMSEIDRLLTLGLRNPVALRINPDVGAGHHTDVVTAGDGVKFGIDLAEVETARMVVEDGGRQVVGIHAHIGSGIDRIAPLIQSARTLLELAPAFPNLRFINFGGGISVPYRPGEAEFPIDDYARELTRVAGNFLRARDLTAILEPGRYLVAESGTLLATVTARRVSGGLTWIGLDTGFNHLVRPSKYGAYHHIVNASHGSERSLRASYDAAQPREELVVAGNLCESGDVFTRDPQGHCRGRSIRPRWVTWWRSATPAPTGSPWPRSTTPGRCRPRCSSTVGRRASSGSVRRSTNSCGGWHEEPRAAGLGHPGPAHHWLAHGRLYHH
jgi:diaminopimelate decarboxylase